MRFSHFGYSVLGAALTAASAQAGGFSRGTADTDILYEDGNFNFRAGATIVVPSHEFSSAPAAQPPGLVGTDYLDTYVIPSAAVKFGITENLACAGTFTDTNGADSTYAVPYGQSAKLSEEFTVAEFGATCAVFFDMGRGRLSVLGGGFAEKFDYDLVAGAGAVTIGLDSTAYGWRAGVGYEIPDIALRAQLMYRSGTTHHATGLANGLFPAFASGDLPQSVELKVQSGIAPGWLAFGSVKWTDWSVNETLTISVPSFPVPGGLRSENQYFWRDGWTVTGGVGHAFNESISGLVSLQWDRGVATGFDFRSDKWLLAGGVSMKDSIGGELRLGAGVSYLTSASIDDPRSSEFGYAVDSGWAGILSASYSVKW